ncbi:MAG TPA: oligosaccharide flippase family protein [Planosporangium sp.]|nr:oligosaccharide flippase family protein [Planosporangium sp.]
MARTAFFNVAGTIAAGAAGIIIARALGPSSRGEYAAITAWFGAAFTVAELGLTAATTFFVARDSRLAPHYLATARNLLITSGVLMAAIGMLAAGFLAPGNGTAALGYRIAFLTCLASMFTVSYLASMQAFDISRWNLIRISQPGLYLAVVALLHLTGDLGLTTAVTALSITTIAQSALAYLISRGQRLTGGHAALTLARPMIRYGMAQFASSVPILVTARLDQLVLSLTVAPAALGNYAIAATLAALAVPIVSALGHVIFPRLASQALSESGADRLQRRAVLAAAGVGGALTLVLAISAPLLVPAIFGAGYRDAIPLVWLLAPGAVFTACCQVCGDLLRGHGRPLAVARAQGFAAVVTVVLLATLLPVLGVTGAALASSAANGVALLMMLQALRKPSVESRATAAAPVRPAAQPGAHDLP